MYIKKVLNELKKELDEGALEKAEAFLEKELSSCSFYEELNHYIYLFEDNDLLSELIIKSILLGLGRNRTINVLKDYDVNRTLFEKTRDKTSIVSSERRKDNERIITSFKWESNTRAKRLAEIAEVDWDSIKKDYSNGSSLTDIQKEYGIRINTLKEQLKYEGLYKSNRSTIVKRDKAEIKYTNIDNEYIKNLVRDNPLTSKEDLWMLAKKKYPWLLRRQMYDKIDELGLARSEDEVNLIRSIKSKTESNTDYMIKVNGYKAAKETYGDISILVEKYMNNELGSFRKISDTINKKNTFGHEVSVKQVSKIITRHPSYVRTESLGQKQLYYFIKKEFNEFNVIEEFPWDDENPNNKIDVLIKDLNIGIEFNGDYWHSDAVIKYNYGKSSKEFHNDRANELSKRGIRLLYVWGNDWNNNYEAVENAIVNKNWDSNILNKKENISRRSNDYYAPDRLPSLLRNQVLRFLYDNNIEFDKENNNHLIYINDYNIIVNIPNYNSLSNEKECLNLQTYYENKGIEVLTFLPWRDIYKVKEFLAYRLRLKKIKSVSARKCDVHITDGITREEKDFFARNHLLGYDINFMHVDKTVSLVYKGEPVISALFVRKSGSQSAELKRLVSAYGVSVQGGASRLLTAFIRNSNNLNEITTFSDSDLGFGNVYKVLGFEMIERSKEQLSWFNETMEQRFSNLSLVTQGADRLLSNFPNYEKVGVGEGLPSNVEIVESYNFLRIYDSGYKKWKLDLKEMD